MRKQRKIWGIILGVLGGMTILNVILFIVGVFSPLAFGLLLAFQIIGGALIVWRIVVLTKKLKRKHLERKLQDVAVKKDDDPTAIYKILGIPVQYDDTGRVLTIYELLGLTPMYDENGKRIKTIYEDLEINPTFSKDGKEIPTVVIIKNRSGKLAKVKSATHIHFKRKLTPEQRERLELLKLLRIKQEEAAKKGDKDKVKTISAAIKKVKNSAKTEDIKPLKEKAIKTGKVKDFKLINGKHGKNVKIERASVFDLFKKDGKSDKPSDKKPPEQSKSASDGNKGSSGGSTGGRKPVIIINNNTDSKTYKRSFEKKPQDAQNTEESEMTN